MEEKESKTDNGKLADCLAEIMKKPVPTQEENDFLESIGVEPESRTNRVMIMARLVERGKKGDASAIREICSIMQETEKSDNGVLASLFEAVKLVE